MFIRGWLPFSDPGIVAQNVLNKRQMSMQFSTDRFDAFEALVEWVEHGKAPDRLLASAAPTSPWPGRTRPLCPYPQVATYKGTGSPSDAANFQCK